MLEESEDKGVVVGFMGILEATISPENMHPGSLFNGNWVLPYKGNQAFRWQKGDKARFKIHHAGKQLTI